MPKTHNTEDWELRAYIGWKAKYHNETCHACGGSGITPRGLHEYGDDPTCYTCRGMGQVLCEPKTKEPPLPAELVEHMRRAWWDYHNKGE